MSMDRMLAAILQTRPGHFLWGQYLGSTRKRGYLHWPGLSSFCWNADGQLVGEQEPTTETDGSIAVKRIAEVDGSQVQVEVPDGQVIAVDERQVKPRPTPIRPPSSIPTR